MSQERSLPPIDFSTFLMSLSASALCHLGQVPNPDGGECQTNLPLAKQTIDILAMMQDKTKGNLSRDETKLLENLLYDLRVHYVQASKK